MAFVSITSQIVLQMTNNTANCSWYLLAKDGIYVKDAPRNLTRAYMSSGNRADVVLQCMTEGFVAFGAVEGYNVNPQPTAYQETIFTFTVEDTGASMAGALPRFNAKHPNYLADTVNNENAVDIAVDVSGNSAGCTVNGFLWDGKTPVDYIETGSILKITNSGVNRHPTHFHVNPVQIQLENGINIPNAYIQHGDWHDVYMEPQMPAGSEDEHDK